MTNLGIALASLGRDPEAQAQFEEVLTLNPGNPTARNQLDVLLSRQHRGE